MAKIPQRKRFFFGCEGASERSYVKFMQTLADRKGLHVHFRAEVIGGGDPLAVVEGAIAASRRLRRQIGNFDHEAILLDRDRLGESPQRDQRIESSARNANLTLIWQDLDHEAFLIRHIPGQETRQIGRGNSLAAIRQFWPEYEKPVDAIWLLDRISIEDWHRMIEANPALKAFFVRTGIVVGD